MECRLLLLILISCSFTKSDEIPDKEDDTLCPPSDLEVAKLEPNEVLLGWKFARTAGCSMTEKGKVNFSIVYESFRKSSKLMVAPGNKSLRIQLGDLEPGTKYSVKIRAIAGDAFSNETLGFFRTLGEEWPSPEVNVSVVRLANKLGLSVQWDIIRDESLREFETEFCAPKCTNQTFVGADRVANFVLDYHTNYSVRVHAMFRQPMEQSIQTSSTVIQCVSPVGAPDGSIELTKTFQVENLLHLAWGPPEKPNGPIDTYDLVVRDALRRSSRNQMRLSATETGIELPPLSGYEFIVEIRAVNIDPRTAEEFFGDWTAYSFSRTLPGEPGGIEVVERKMKSLKLKVIPSSNSTSLRYRIVTGSNSGEVKEEFVEEEVEIRGLKVYQNVSVFVSACYSDRSGGLTCGEFFSGSATSNVAAPSAVRDLSASSSGKGLVVAWKEPMVCNGPIDGYMIFINASDSSSPPQLSNESIAPWPLNYTLDRVDSEKLYEFSVAAFNFDLETENMLLSERSTVRQIKTSSAWLAALMAIGVVIGIAGAALAIHFLVRMRKKPDASPPVTVTFTRDDVRRN